MEPYKIWYDPEPGFVRMLWQGYCTSVQFRAGTELMYELLVEHGADKVLGDIKDMVLIGMEDQQWLLKDFLPRAIRKGCRAVALVQPDHYFNKVAVETVNDQVSNSSLRVRMFGNAAEAEDWLREVKVNPETV